MEYSVVCVVLALIATINGAPHRIRRSRHSSYDYEELISELSEFNQNSDDFIREPLFDTPANFHRAFNFAGFVDGKYKIFIPLPGYTRDDIRVVLIQNEILVEAMHRSLWSYSDYYFEKFTVPYAVSTKGAWEYEGGVLTLELDVPRYGPPDVRSNPTEPTITPTTTEKTLTEPNVISTTPKDPTEYMEITTNDEAATESVPVFSSTLLETTTKKTFTIPNVISAVLEYTTVYPEIASKDEATTEFESLFASELPEAITKKTTTEPSVISAIPEDTTADSGITSEDETTTLYEPVFTSALPETTTGKTFTEPNVISGTPDDTTAYPEITSKYETTPLSETVFTSPLPSTTSVEGDISSIKSEINPVTQNILPETTTTKTKRKVTLADTFYAYYDFDAENTSSKPLTLEITTKSLELFTRDPFMLYPELGNELDIGRGNKKEDEIGEDLDQRTVYF